MSSNVIWHKLERLGDGVEQAQECMLPVGGFLLVSKAGTERVAQFARQIEQEIHRRWEDTCTFLKRETRYCQRRKISCTPNPKIVGDFTDVLFIQSQRVEFSRLWGKFCKGESDAFPPLRRFSTRLNIIGCYLASLTRY